MKCQYCQKEFKRECGLAMHERSCDLNPNKIPLNNNGHHHNHEVKPGGWVCSHCNIIFRTQSELRDHKRTCSLKVHIHSKENRKCKFCGIERFTTREGMTRHENYCKLNPHAKKYKAHYHSEEWKKLHSNRMKKYFIDHPEKRSWCSNTAYISKPCEDLKKFLKEKGYSFEEEVMVVPNRLFSADICFKEIALVIEVNGFRHYIDNSLQLTDHCLYRHNLIESFGWTVLEIPVGVVYDDTFRANLCNIIESRYNGDTSITIDVNSLYMKKHKSAIERKEIHDKKYEECSLLGKLDKNGKISMLKISNSDLIQELILLNLAGLKKFQK